MSLFGDPVFLVEWVMLSAVIGVAMAASHMDLTRRLVPNGYMLCLLVVGVVGQGTMVLRCAAGGAGGGAGVAAWMA